jgi:hypothetical protein
MSKLQRTALALLLVVFGGAVARAQEDYGYGYPSDEGYGYDDPEIRQTVARVAYISGNVSFARGDDPDAWQPADPNIPMTLGDRIWTAGGRLELQVHGGSLIRLARSTDLTALNLTEDTKQFSLAAGVASFRIRRLDDDEVFEVDTPNAAVTFERTGDYRIDVRPDGDTRVQVRHGRAWVASGGGQVPLGSGDAILIEGDEIPRYDMIGMPRPDGWDSWVADRNARYANVRSYAYVSADIAGVEDLDRYGRWQQVPSYGWCWTPLRISVGWQPYRVGRWIWQDPWGWTWVSAEPWGWAPYHYGRWVVWSSRWYWVPVAPRVTAVAYSPALVAFVGGGPGFSVSVGFGTDYIGWFPLAPRDPLVPWWGRPAVNVNVTNITYVNRTYVTVVNQNTFVSSRVVTTNYVRDQSIVSRIERAPVVRGAIPIAPTRESIRVTTRQAAAPRPPAAVASRTVVTRMAPPPAPPRFDSKVAVIRENRGRPVTTVEAERIVTRESRTAARPARAVRPAAAESGRVSLAPKTENPRAPKPEPVAPARGRPLATKEQPEAPSRPNPARRSDRATTPAREVQPEGVQRDREQSDPDDAVRAQREQAQRDQEQREQVERQEAQREREQAQREQAERQQAQREQAQREQAQREQAQREQAERQQAQREQAQREQAQKQQAQREQAQREQAQKQQAQREQAQREQAQKQQAQREQAQKQQAQREQAQREQVQKQQAQREQAEREQAQRQQAQREQAQRERPTARPAPDDQSGRTQAPPPSEEKSQAQSARDDKEQPETKPSPQRGRGRTPKPEPTKKNDG